MAGASRASPGRPGKGPSQGDQGGQFGCALLKGLREDRKPIFASGLAILLGIFEQLGLTHMQVSSGALREGLLYDLLGRFSHEDVRERSIQAILNRYHVERAQAERVSTTARGSMTRWPPPGAG